MANTNDMNTPTKVPCGGFVTGAGLKVENGKVSVNGGVETWIWCEMINPSSSENMDDFGVYYIKAIHVMDANFNELWSFTPEAPSRYAGLKECMTWLAENDRVDNIGFGRMMISGKNPNYEPWFLTKIVDYEEKDRYMKGYQFISMRPFTILSGAKQGYAQNEYQLYFVKPRSTMKWKYQGAMSVKYLFSMFSTAST